MIKKIFLIVLFLHMEMSISATFWTRVSNFYTKAVDTAVRTHDTFWANTSGGIVRAAQHTGEHLPWAIVVLCFELLRRKVATIYNPSDKETEAFLLSQYNLELLERVETKLIKHKEELDEEWEQLEDDQKELHMLKKKLKQKLSGNKGYTQLLKGAIFGSSQNKSNNSTDVKQLQDNIDELEVFLEKRLNDHKTRRNNLADMINAYHEKYKKFLQKDVSQEI
jgi:chromosome segregation ATPase